MKKRRVKIRRGLKLSFLIMLVVFVMGIGKLFQMPNWWPKIWGNSGIVVQEKTDNQKEKQETGIPENTSSLTSNSTINSETTSNSETTRTLTASPKPTNTFSPKPTNTPSPKPTNTPSPRPTNTPSPRPTNTPSPRPTNTPSPRPTNTPSPKPTNIIVTSKPLVIQNTPTLPFVNKESSISKGSNDVPTPNIVPIATVKPRPKVPTKMFSLYFTKQICSEIKEKGIYETNSLTLQVEEKSLKISSVNDEEILLKIKISQKDINDFIASGIKEIKIPFANISLNEMRIQLEETRADQVEFVWEEDGRYYNLRAKFSNQNIFLNWLYSMGGDRSMIIK